MKILKFFVTALALVGLAACELIPTPQPNPGGEITHSFKVTASKQVIVPNGSDATIFTATFDGKDVTNSVEIYDEKGGEIVLDNFTFSTDKEGDYKFFFKYTFEEKTYEHDVITIAAKNLSAKVNTTVFQKDVDDVYFEIYYKGELVTCPDDNLIFFDYNTNAIIDHSSVEVELNGQMVTLPKFVAPSVGEHKVYLFYKTSNTRNKPITLTAVDFALPKRLEDAQPENLSFTKRAFFTQFTGTGCSFCPFISTALHDMKNDPEVADKFYNAAAHTYNDASDLAPLQNLDIDERFGISNYPYIVGDMKFRTSNVGSWSLNKTNLVNYVNQSVAEGAKAGISASISSEGNTVVVRATVKAAANGKYRVGAWLVEDGIYSPQASGMSAPYPDGMVAKDLNYHNNVLRIADSNPAASYVGHDLGELNAGDLVDHVFVMNIKEDAAEAGKTNETMNHKTHWVKENCRLVFFVTTESMNGFYVTNAIGNTSLTENIAFDYQ